MDAKVDPKDAEIAALKLELAAAKGNEKAGLRKNLPLAAEYKGTKTYVVGAQKHYRNGKLYQAGELVTVTDERPAKDWVLADASEVKAAKVTPVAGRASDKNVG